MVWMCNRHLVIETVNSCSFTPLAAVDVVMGVITREKQAEFNTPARLFYANFAESILGTKFFDQRDEAIEVRFHACVALVSIA